MSRHANESKNRTAKKSRSKRHMDEERVAYYALLLENVHDAIVATDERLVVKWK